MLAPAVNIILFLAKTSFWLALGLLAIIGLPFTATTVGLLVWGAKAK